MIEKRVVDDFWKLLLQLDLEFLHEVRETCVEICRDRARRENRPRE